MSSAHNTTTPITKSQLVVCGATAMTIFGTSGKLPSNRQPETRISIRPSARLTTLPRRSYDAGTISNRPIDTFATPSRKLLASFGGAGLAAFLRCL